MSSPHWGRAAFGNAHGFLIVKTITFLESGQHEMGEILLSPRRQIICSERSKVTSRFTLGGVMSHSSAASWIAVCAAITAIPLRGDASGPIVPTLSPTPTMAVSTIPSNGDLNPYGVAFVPSGFPSGLLSSGDILVSNFNASSNLQGTGTTIVRIDPRGRQSLFFQGPAGLGFTTALGVLKGGFVLVGNVPTTKSSATCRETPSGNEHGVGEGSLLILDQHAHIIGTLKNQKFLDGPWDLTIHDRGTTAEVFVSNVLSATVTRLDLTINSGQLAIVQTTQIASGYAHRCDPAALVVGPTGLALDPNSDTLYVASTGDNVIYALSHASTATGDQGTGTPLIRDAAHLHGPLALVLAPNGDLITSQGDAVNADPSQPSEIVEFNAAGQFKGQLSIDATLGSAFGLALGLSDGSLRLAVVDDTLNVLDIWILSQG
jgi:hypothetical protein